LWDDRREVGDDVDDANDVDYYYEWINGTHKIQVVKVKVCVFPFDVCKVFFKCNFLMEEIEFGCGLS